MRSLVRTSLAALALSLAAGSAHAQFTAKAGLSFASTSGSDLVPDLDTRTGFAAGIGYGLDIGRILEIRPEVLFVQKGGKFANDGGTLKLNEINIPLLLQVDIPITGLMPYAYAGPQAEIELKCTALDTDCVDTKSLRWGAVAGLGIRFAKVVSVEGRYNWTLSEIADDLDAKPRTILLLVGISFGAKQ